MNKRFTIGKFPRTRLRRNRQSPWCRNLISETELSINDLILPLFITEGKKIVENINSLPSVKRYSIDTVVKKIEEVKNLNIPAVALFPYVEKKLKTLDGKEALNKNNLICRSIREVKKNFPEIGLICDVALDPYTTHGHDGILKKNYIANDETIEVLSQQALTQAEAGADIIAPSDMMDGRIGYLRDTLDQEGFTQTSIMSYTAKYASAFYGPFRDALDSAPKSGNKKSYQMNPANKNEALIEAELDYQEGADMMMVKPATCYLDIIHLLKENFDIPITAYNVSGECAMIYAASANGWLDYESSMAEMLLSIRRAGADGILTYFAKDFAKFSKG